MVGKWSLPFWDVVVWEDRVVAFTQSPKSWIKELCVYFRGVYSEEIRAVDGVNLVMHLDPEEFPTDVFWIVSLILWCWCWCIYHFITLWSFLTCCFFPSFFPIPLPTGQPFPSGFQAKSLLCWATMVPANPPPCRRFAVWQLQPKAGSMTSPFFGGTKIRMKYHEIHVDLARFIARWYFSLRPQCTQRFGGSSQIYGILSTARRSLPSILAHGWSFTSPEASPAALEVIWLRLWQSFNMWSSFHLWRAGPVASQWN